MIPLIEQHRAELNRLCREFKVNRLELFGSAASNRFQNSTSDLDFIVSFADTTTDGYADRYLNFALALERLFQRKVDLVTERSIRNPFFRQAVESAREPVYDHRSEEAVA
jgi:hypothetical protein